MQARSPRTCAVHGCLIRSKLAPVVVGSERATEDIGALCPRHREQIGATIKQGEWIARVDHAPGWRLILDLGAVEHELYAPEDQ